MLGRISRSESWAGKGIRGAIVGKTQRESAVEWVAPSVA